MGNNNRLVRLSPLAAADLEEIWLYTLHQWSLEQADTYVRAIAAAFQGIATGQLVAKRTDVRAGYWKYRVGKHVIYFKISADYLEVIRVLHGSMDVDSHLKDNAPVIDELATNAACNPPKGKL